MNRKKQHYQDSVVKTLQDAFGKKNAMAVAKLEKIVINVGIGSDPQGEKAVEPVVAQLSAITGQKPRVNSARISIAGFKLRQGTPVGVSVTLRGDRMWEFFDKLVTVVLPQLKDFSGVSRTAFDKTGNYTLGLREQIVFPEIEYDAIDRVRGMQITMSISHSNGPAESMLLLQELGMPFAKEENN